jgi:hypothetical protein
MKASVAWLLSDSSGGGGGGTTNYNNLENLPQINGTILKGNKSNEDLSLIGDENHLSPEELNNLLSLI